MKQSLLHKGLLLVAIPLCFEVSIFGWLIHLQDNLEQEYLRLNRSQQIYQGVNQIVNDTVAILDDLEKFNYGPDPIEHSLAHNLRDVRLRMVDINSTFDQLLRVSIDDPPVHDKIRQCAHGFRLAADEMIQLRNTVTKLPMDEIDSVLHNARHRLSDDVHLSLHAGLLDLETQSLKAADDMNARQMRDQQRLILKIALLSSVLLACLFAATITLSIMRRLKRLSINAEKLARDEELLPVMEGSDEVADLDRSFHHAAELVRAAKRMRQEVTAMITHDLKTPLQSIRSYLEMLEAGMLGDLNEQGKKLLTTTETVSDHMVSLINSVLELEKLRTGSVNLKTSRIELEQLIDDSVEKIKILADSKDVTVATDFNRSSPSYVMGDAFWLQEIFVNILSNAVKYTPSKTSVSVSIGRSDNAYQVAITDQGPGIAEKDMKLIFERFHRLQNTDDVAGTGLGLPIAKELIEMHHGSIAVRSELGKGTTFIIRLPITTAEQA